MRESERDHFIVCLHPCMGKLAAQFRQSCVTTRKSELLWTNTPQQLSALTQAKNSSLQWRDRKG